MVAVLRKKEKKKLAINQAEARLDKLILQLCLEGPEGGAPMGIKTISDYLNRNGHSHREQRFYTSMVADILKRSTYMGTHYYNQRNSRTRRPRPPSE